MLNGGEPTAVGQVSNDGASTIALTVPYHAVVTVEGSSALLFHRWSNEAVAEKAAARKGSKAKKTDDVESYVYRNQAGEICLPGRYLIGSMIDPRNGAAKYRQDPRSTRKSALDLFRAGVVAVTELAPIHSVKAPDEAAKTWDYLDSQRVTVQRNGVTRVRPAFLAGWRTTVQLLVLTPEYVSQDELHETLTMAGRLVGVGDFRPTYGRFQVRNFEVGLDA